jgi:hypothetical protein
VGSGFPRLGCCDADATTDRAGSATLLIFMRRHGLLTAHSVKLGADAMQVLIGRCVRCDARHAAAPNRFRGVET